MGYLCKVCIFFLFLYVKATQIDEEDESCHTVTT